MPCRWKCSSRASAPLCHAPGGRVAGEADRAPGARRCQYDLAVQAAARDAHDRDYQVLVLEEACAAASDEEHRRSIEVLGGIARIVTLDQLAAL